MKRHISNPAKLDENGSDALSTATNNSGRRSNGEHSPAIVQNGNSEETDSLCDGSKKIRKKRNAYQKIDDDVRLKLLEAVKHGETLKSAAKKYKINYSSAKSILHTYRKEGRILKKSAQERNIKRNSGPDGDIDQSPEGNFNSETALEPNVSSKAEPAGYENEKMEIINTHKEDNNTKLKGVSPVNGLVDNFVNLLKLNSSSGSAQGEDNERLGLKVPSKIIPRVAGKDSGENQANQTPKSKMQTLIGMAGNLENSFNLANLSQFLQGNPLENMKALGNLFPDNSVISGINKNASDQTESTKPQEKAAKGFESFSEAVNVLENQPKQGEEIIMPHPLRFNTAQLLQEKIESKLSGSEDADWDRTIENAAIDTFKSFMDAQLLLYDALKKASYLNTLMQAQKSREEAGSVANDQLQGYKNV